MAHQNLRALFEKFPYVSKLIFTQSECCFWQHAVDLLGVASSDDSSGYGWIVECPCDDGYSGLNIVPFTDDAQ